MIVFIATQLFGSKQSTNIEWQLIEKLCLDCYEYTIDFNIWYIVNLLIIWKIIFSQSEKN